MVRKSSLLEFWSALKFIIIYICLYIHFLFITNISFSIWIFLYTPTYKNRFKKFLSTFFLQVKHFLCCVVNVILRVVNCKPLNWDFYSSLTCVTHYWWVLLKTIQRPANRCLTPQANVFTNQIEKATYYREISIFLWSFVCEKMRWYLEIVAGWIFFIFYRNNRGI